MTAVTDQDHTEQAGNAVPGESGDGERPVEEPLPEADAEVEPEGEDEHARAGELSAALVHRRAAGGRWCRCIAACR